jgi:hypothetical protein
MSYAAWDELKGNKRQRFRIDRTTCPRTFWSMRIPA